MLKDTLCCYLSRVAVLSLYEHLSAAVCKRPAGIYRLLPDVTLQTKKQIFQNFYICRRQILVEIRLLQKLWVSILKAYLWKTVIINGAGIWRKNM